MLQHVHMLIMLLHNLIPFWVNEVFTVCILYSLLYVVCYCEVDVFACVCKGVSGGVSVLYWGPRGAHLVFAAVDSPWFLLLLHGAGGGIGRGVAIGRVGRAGHLALLPTPLR